MKHPTCQRSLPESLKNDTTWLWGQAKGSAGNLRWQPAQAAPLFALTVALTSPTVPFAPQLFRVLRSDTLNRSSQAHLFPASARVQTMPALSDLSNMSRFHKISDLGIKTDEG